MRHIFDGFAVNRPLTIFRVQISRGGPQYGAGCNACTRKVSIQLICSFTQLTPKSRIPTLYTSNYSMGYFLVEGVEFTDRLLKFTSSRIAIFVGALHKRAQILSGIYHIIDNLIYGFVYGL